MRLQLALDDIELERALLLLEELDGCIDIAEVGTPMIIAYGMEAVRRIRERFPRLTITADAKIMDAGEYEAAQCFGAGADIVTVMGYTHDETLRGAVSSAAAYKGEVMADMMCVPNLEERAARLKEIGVRYICVHAAADVQGTEDPYHELAALRKSLTGESCCIAGGVNARSMPRIAGLAPEIVIVGGAITKAEAPRAAALAIRAAMESDKA